MQPGHCRAAARAPGACRAPLWRCGAMLAALLALPARPPPRPARAGVPGQRPVHQRGRPDRRARGDGLRVPVCAEGRAGAPGHRGARRRARPGLAGYRFQALSERDLRGHARGQRRPARVHRGLWRIAAHARARKHRVQWHDGPHGGGSATELLLFSPVKPAPAAVPCWAGRAGARHGGRARGGGRPAVGHGGIEPARRFRARGGRHAVKAVPVDSITGFLREQARSMRSATGLSWAPCRRRRARDAVGRHYLRMRGERCEPPSAV